MSLAEQLIEHEGLRLKPYLDCCGKPWRECRCRKKGKLTVGVGRNLDANGLSHEEVRVLLANDIEQHTKEMRLFAWFDGLSRNRKNALIDMHFNLGHTGFRQFRKMIAAIVRSDFDAAADEMLRSKWSKQVGQRAKTLAQMMREG